MPRKNNELFLRSYFPKKGYYKFSKMKFVSLL